jgi:hypothetical protein
MQQWQHKRLNLGAEVSIAVGVLLLIVGYAVWRYPGSISRGGGTDVTVIYTVLLAHGAAAMAVRRAERPMTRAAIRRGSIVGLLVGAVAILNTAIDQFMSIDVSLRQTAMLATMVVIVVMFGTAAVWAGKLTSSRRLAILASMWAAVVGGVVTCLYSFAGNLTFMKMLETSLHAAYVESGLEAPRDFVVHNTLEATSSHLLVVPVLALIAGAAGAWIAAFLPKFGYVTRHRYRSTR